MKGRLNIRNEEILLLGLCRLTFSNEQAAKIRDLAGTISDWKYFVNLANEHGVVALACHNLEQLGLISIISAEEVSVLKNALMRNLSRNIFHTEAISSVLAILNKENIKTVILKGLALEITIYGNQGLRQMTDVDILLERKECIRARKILIANGFTSLPVKSIFHKMIVADAGKHLPSLLKNGTSVEIHHKLFGGSNNILTKLLMQNSYKILIKDQVAYIPDPQLFFLYLVKHLYLHEMNNESQLRLYTDLVVLIAKFNDQIINNILLAQASKAGMTQILAWKLQPLRDLWGIHFPGWMNDFIDKWYSPDSINKFVFFLKSPKNNPPAIKTEYYRRIIKEIPGTYRKALFILGDLFPSLSFMKKRYKVNSNLKALFYYPHRFGKLFWLFKWR
jgi:hypothetical protein